VIHLDLNDSQEWKAWIVDEFESKWSLNLSAFCALGPDGRRFITLVARNLSGKRAASQKSQLTKINAEIGAAVRAFQLTALPKRESDWQDLVVRFYEYALGRTDTKRTLANRVKDWNSNLAHHLETLRDAHDLIPLGVEIPRARVSEAAIAQARELTQLLGQPKPSPETKAIDKTLVSVSIGRTDAEYLEEIRDSLSEKRRVLEDALLRWWCQIKEHFEYGEKLVQETNLDALLAQLSIGSAGPVEKAIRLNTRLADGRTETTLGNLLSLLHHFHGSNCNAKDFEKSTLYFPCHATIRVPASAPSPVSVEVSVFDRISWMLGSLNHTDIAVCAALLMMRNPTFTSHSLLLAKVKDKNGRPYLELNNSGLSFRIEKPRAVKMSDSLLDDVSYELVTTLIRMSRRYRKRVIVSNPAVGNLLFLCRPYRADQIHRVPNLAQVHRKLQGTNDAGRDHIYQYFPDLDSVLPRGTISLSKIRATEGVLEWFRTGSIQRMSKKLGNTKRVVINHYIPRPLLDAWNTRLIRRFQNLLLAVAAADEDFLLAVTDFQALEDLHCFLAQMLEQHSTSSSSLGKELHERFSVLSNCDQGDSASRANLTVSISARTLTYLYLYQETVLKAGVGAAILDQPDPVSGLHPRYFLDLAELLRHQLPSHRNSDMREAHFAAESKMGGLINKTQWTDLLLRRVRSQHAQQ
jgi:hypothetical protein